MKKIATIYNGKVSDLIEVLTQYKDAEIYVCGTSPIVVYHTDEDDANIITIDHNEDLVEDEEDEEISNKELERHCIRNWNGTYCVNDCKYKNQCNKYISKYGHTPLFGEEI